MRCRILRPEPHKRSLGRHGPSRWIVFLTLRVVVRRFVSLCGVFVRCVLLCGVSVHCALFGVGFRCAVFLCIVSALLFGVVRGCVALRVVVRCSVLLSVAPPVRSCTPENSLSGLGGMHRPGGDPRWVPSRATVGYKKGGFPLSLFPLRQLGYSSPCLVPTIHGRD